MLKAILFIALLLTLTASAFAQQQSSASASQTIRMVLQPIIDIDFGDAAHNGAPVNLAFNDHSNLNNGVTSAGQELRIRSNKEFKVSVQTDASSFSYNGPANAPVMSVSDILSVSVTGNNTGGLVASAFDNNYSPLSPTSQDILMDGQRGGEQKFTVAYKAKPGYRYPAGTYSVGVVYTATQP